MDIVVLSDIHGNLPALRTVLEHIATNPPDAIFCLGDMFAPYPGSREIWALLKQYHVQCVLGNNEAALLAQHDGSHDYAADPVRFRPFLKNVQEVTPFVDELRAIPASRSVAVTNSLSLHLCHYSPDEVFRGLHSPFTFSLDAYVQQCPESVILTGHLHRFEAKDLYGKVVYTVGSAGLPLKGTHQLEYTRLTLHNNALQLTYHLVPYPVQQAIDYLMQAGFMREYGPIAWLAFDEILTQRDRLVTFFKEFLPAHPSPSHDWYYRTEQFLRTIGRWEVIQSSMN